MKTKVFDKRNMSIPLLAGVVIVLGIGLIMNRRTLTNTRIPGNSITGDISSSNFDTVTRLYTSPEVKGPDGAMRIFTLVLPQEWNIEKEINENGLYIIYSKGESRIIINEQYEGARCIFPEYKSQGEFGYLKLEDYKYIATSFGDYRIGYYIDENDGRATFLLCENVGVNDPNTSSPWEARTKLGLVSYSTTYNFENNFDLDKVQEIERLIQSITFRSIY